MRKFVGVLAGHGGGLSVRLPIAVRVQRLQALPDDSARDAVKLVAAQLRFPHHGGRFEPQVRDALNEETIPLIGGWTGERLQAHADDAFQIPSERRDVEPVEHAGPPEDASPVWLDVLEERCSMNGSTTSLAIDS